MKHTYEFTWGDEQDRMLKMRVGEAEVRVTYTFTAGRPAYISGPPEDCYPAEGPEIEIEKVEVKYFNWETRKYLWREASTGQNAWLTNEFEVYSEYALEKHFDDMAQAAAEDEQAAAEDAAEQAMEESIWESKH